MRTCQVTLRTTMNEICERFQLGEALQLRQVMKDAKAVISGSNALLPFYRGTFEAGDLDIYLPVRSCLIIRAFLLKQGYRQAIGPQWYTQSNPSIRVVHSWKKDDLSIDVIYSRSNSAIQLIAEFSSTLVMNYIAWFGLVSLYPRLTLQKVGVVNSSSPGAVASRLKYEARGFEFVEHVREQGRHVCKIDKICPSTIRSIHDTGVMFVPFRGCRGSLHDHEETLCWRLNNNTCGGKGRGFTVGDKGDAGKV